MAFFIKKELTSDPFLDLKSALHCGQTPYINRRDEHSLKTKKRRDKIFLKPPPYHRVAFNYFLEAVPRKDIFTSVKYFKV